MGPKETGAAALVLVALFLGYRAFGPQPQTAEGAALRLDAGTDVPEIGLARVGQKNAPLPPPTRDVFTFGRRDLSAVPTPVIALPPTPPPTPIPTPEGPPTPTPWPPLNVVLAGIVDNGAGRRVGSFVKDGEILLVGEAGQVLGNVFRVIRIGQESAEIEELGSGRTRRLALKTN